MLLLENSLYVGQEAKEKFLADKQKVTDAFYMNLLGFLSLVFIDSKSPVFQQYLASELRLHPNQITDANHDVSLLTKVMMDENYIPTPAAMNLTKLLVKIKRREVTSENLSQDTIRGLFAQFKIMNHRPSARLMQVIQSFLNGKSDLPNTFLKLVALARQPDYKAIAGELYNLVMRGSYIPKAKALISAKPDATPTAIDDSKPRKAPAAAPAKPVEVRTPANTPAPINKPVDPAPAPTPDPFMTAQNLADMIVMDRGVTLQTYAKKNGLRFGSAYPLGVYTNLTADQLLSKIPFKESNPFWWYHNTFFQTFSSMNKVAIALRSQTIRQLTAESLLNQKKNVSTFLGYEDSVQQELYKQVQKLLRNKSTEWLFKNSEGLQRFAGLSGLKRGSFNYVGDFPIVAAMFPTWYEEDAFGGLIRELSYYDAGVHTLVIPTEIYNTGTDVDKAWVKLMKKRSGWEVIVADPNTLESMIARRVKLTDDERIDVIKRVIASKDLAKWAKDKDFMEFLRADSQVFDMTETKKKEIEAVAVDFWKATAGMQVEFQKSFSANISSDWLAAYHFDQLSGASESLVNNMRNQDAVKYLLQRDDAAREAGQSVLSPNQRLQVLMADKNLDPSKEIASIERAGLMAWNKFLTNPKMMEAYFSIPANLEYALAQEARGGTLRLSLFIPADKLPNPEATYWRLIERSSFLSDISGQMIRTIIQCNPGLVDVVLSQIDKKTTSELIDWKGEIASLVDVDPSLGPKVANKFMDKHLNEPADLATLSVQLDDADPNVLLDKISKMDLTTFDNKSFWSASERTSVSRCIAMALIKAEKASSGISDAFFKTLPYELRHGVIDYVLTSKALIKFNDIFQNSEIKPYDDMTVDRLGQILKYNKIDLPKVNRRSIKTMADMEAILDTVKMIPDLELQPFTGDLDVVTAQLAGHSNGRHGRQGPKVLRAWNVAVPVMVENFPGWQSAYLSETEITAPMFHGTGSVAASFILRNGFTLIPESDPSAVGKMLGNGIYMSNVIDKVSQYVGDAGYARAQGTRGFIFEMQVKLGKSPEEHRSAGLNSSQDDIRSPEWCVFTPNSQLNIVKVYEIELVDSEEIDQIRMQHSAPVAPTLSESFEEHLMEAKTGGKPVSSWVFQDGYIPTANGKWVLWNEYKPKKGVEVSPSQQGPVVTVVHNDPESKPGSFVVYNTADFWHGKTYEFKRFLRLTK
ncbi:ADP ribosyltransferase [Stenotrophomonas phage Moby]|uniref:ADP ribosyltransferase n=1 Tax=Stenotrophomonas phage Moby TaxID=2601680 RepID=A0A5P8PMD3_9CAUD|nr:ADP ribosyltransferase [Stenotrophomonas phage Moby]QFR57815.1 ADP ribosyltransferase [Stenotrophomonas phage Moby]